MFTMSTLPYQANSMHNFYVSVPSHEKEEPMSDQKRMHVLVFGRVQGVGFRYFAQRAARKLNLVGTVRNLADGQVEIIAEGDEKILLQFLKKIENGPSFGHVASTQTAWSNAMHQFKDFMITY
jgi:acylphosphatase